MVVVDSPPVPPAPPADAVGFGLDWLELEIFILGVEEVNVVIVVVVVAGGGGGGGAIAGLFSTLA
jgi:hypothetical protein